MRGRCWSQQGIKLPADDNAPGLIFRECVRCGAMNWELAAPLVVEPGETKTIVLRTPAQRNAEVRAREYLTGAEVEKLIAAAGDNRCGHRDATMVLLAPGARGRAMPTPG